MIVSYQYNDNDYGIMDDKYPNNTKKAHCVSNVLFCKTGDVLLSQAVARQVSSAQKSLTTVFEMGTGVASSL